MAAVWQKNQVTASLRRCLLLILDTSNARAPRGTDFTGYVYITRDGTKSVAATGTLTNHRRDLEVDDDVVESVDAGADTLTLTAHSYETGDGPFVADEAFGALAAGEQFWIIDDGANLIGIAESADDAYAGTRVALAGTETGATISDIPGTTERGIDGEFIYTATQAETNYSVAEMLVSIFGHASYYGQTTVNMSTADSSGWSTVTTDGLTRDQHLTAASRTAGAPFTRDPNTGLIVYRDYNDTKDSHEGTITSTGRSGVTVHDLD